MPILVQLVGRIVLTGFVSVLTFLGFTENNQITTTTPREILENTVTLHSQSTSTFELIPSNIRQSSSTPEIIESLSKEAPKIETTSVTPTTSEYQNPIKKLEIKNIGEIIRTNPLPEPWDNLQPNIEKATIDIYCESHKDNKVRIDSGSGVIIDPRGIVLTNAHIGQYFLIPDITSCIIRQQALGSPMYKGQILFLPRSWIDNNAQEFTKSNPKITGENDYALIAITSNIFGTPNRTTYDYLDINTLEKNVKDSDEVILAGFPGTDGLILTLSKIPPLYLETTNVNKIFSFTGLTPDGFSSTPVFMAKKGSSGGPVINKNGEVIGIITSTADIGTEQGISAIFLSYINTNLIKETGAGLSSFLNGDLTQKINSFKNTRMGQYGQKISSYFSFDFDSF